MGFSTPSTGQAGGASPLSLAALGFAVGSARHYRGSAPPPPAKPAEPPPSHLATLGLGVGLSAPSTSL
jgi:hypothetical protein